MADRLAYLKHLQYPSDPITPSQFSSWKQSSTTRELFKDLIKALFDELDAPLPEDFDKTIITAHQREGAMKLLDQLLQWEPQSVRREREKAAMQGMEVVNED